MDVVLYVIHAPLLRERERERERERVNAVITFVSVASG